MKKIENYSDKLLMFEVARLRTMFNKLEKDTFEGKEGKWVTLENGQHIFIREGESLQEAVGRMKPSKPSIKPKSDPSAKLLYDKVKSGEVKAPFKNDEEFHKFIKEHGFTEEEANSIRLVVKKEGPLGVYAGAGEDYIKIAMNQVDKKGELESTTILHELGHIKDKRDSSIRNDWGEKEFTSKLGAFEDKPLQSSMKPNWGDLGSWEIAGYFDADEELIATSYASYWSGDLDKEISNLDGEVIRQNKIIKEREDLLKDLPSKISSVTGKKYTKSSKRYKSIVKDLEWQREALVQIEEVKDYNEEVKVFWDTKLGESEKVEKEEKQQIKDNLGKRIVKRYKLIVDEYNSRNLRWLWSKHKLDQLIKGDWCSEKGGKWITVEGKHICISDDKDLGEGNRQRNILGPDRKIKLTYNVSREDLTDDLSATLNSIPPNSKAGKVLDSDLKEVYLYNHPQTFAGACREQGFSIPEDYERYADEQCGGFYYGSEKKIVMYAFSSNSTLYHEVGHAISPKDYEEANYWAESIWKEEKVSEYAKINWNEGFADAFRQFKLNPSKLKKEYPKTYEYMEEYVHGKN